MRPQGRKRCFTPSSTMAAARAPPFFLALACHVRERRDEEEGRGKEKKRKEETRTPPSVRSARPWRTRHVCVLLPACVGACSVGWCGVVRCSVV